ncbi:MAG: hypothetical protein ACK5L5_01735 [Bacteroidales bacterium]
MKNWKTYALLAALLIGTTSTSWAQDAKTKPTKKENNLRYGIRGFLSFDGLETSSESTFIYGNRPGVALIGGFTELKKWEMNAEIGYEYLSGELGYKFYKNWAAIAGISHTLYYLEINSSRHGYGYDSGYWYSGNCDESWMTHYYIGAGYQNAWGRLKFKANGKIGRTQLTEVVAQSVIDEYDEWYGVFGGSKNKLSLKTDFFQMNPTWTFGANVYLELLPRASKRRVRPIVPFFELTLMAGVNDKSTRSVKVEEWVPGNVVYQETQKDNEYYDLFQSSVRFGLKWYLKY